MKQINREDWANGIGKYIGKYIETIYNMQLEFQMHGCSPNYVKLKRKCEDERFELLKCINSLESTNLLPYHD